MPKQRRIVKSTKPSGRQRGVSIHVFVSAAEAADMKAIAKRRGLTLAQLLRHWIARARGQARPKRRPKSSERQLELHNAGALASLGALVSAVRSGAIEIVDSELGLE